MLIHYHAVELHLFDICFTMPLTELAQVPDLQRADVLFKCVTATEAFLDVYSSILPLPHMIFFTVFMGHIYFAMMTLSKFSLFNAEDWNPDQLPKSLNLSILLDQMARVMEDASARYDRIYDNKPWLIVSRKMRQIGVQFEHLLASENRSLDSLPLLTQGIMGEWKQFDLVDDAFWQSLADVSAFSQ